MADSARFSFLLLFLTLCPLLNLAVSVDSPQISPSLSLHSGADSPPPVAPTPNVKAPLHAPVSSPSVSLPPAPPPMAPSPGSSPTPKPADSITAGNLSGGMSAGKKAGIAIAVIAAACVIGLAGMVYRKRQHNIRRPQFGYVARREIL